MNRRIFLNNAGALTAGLILAGYSKIANSSEKPSSSNEQNKKEVTAVEDLMREHGILRRALFIYSETAVKLRSNSIINIEPLHKTSQIFRRFGQDYHEKQLEEAFIFPAIKNAGIKEAVYVDILATQHQRGRQIINYILTVTQAGQLQTGQKEPLAKAMESLVRMYHPHAAIEDTVIFPDWKNILSSEQYDQMSDKFEEIEHRSFGGNGFEDIRDQIAAIETELGMSDLSQFTAKL
jgi:hemerythrin-like domain-containing protein